MSINIENPVYDVTLGLSKKDFGMKELKKVIKESGDEAGIIFATNYVEKNMDNNPLGAEELQYLAEYGGLDGASVKRCKRCNKLIIQR